MRKGISTTLPMQGAMPASQVATGTAPSTLATLSQQQPYGQLGVFGQDSCAGWFEQPGTSLVPLAQQGHAD
jgi:hypothetical protein